MDTNVQIKSNKGCKELLLKKLSYAVTCSVSIQITLLTTFVFAVNFNPFYPKQWMASSVGTLTSLTTWLFAVPFLSVMFAQSLICAKEYILKATCSTTRIGCFLSIFSMRNVVLLGLHVFSGGLFVWLVSILSGPDRRLIVKCRDEKNCLNEECFFLVLFGVWIGTYYFVWIYARDKTIAFPVIQQEKLLRFQCNIASILKNCQREALLPVVLYVNVYYFYGETTRNFVARSFIEGLSEEPSTRSVLTLFYVYFFATFYIFNMKLMRFFFEIFLTESNEFAIIPINEKDLTLKDALGISYIPVIQHLACLDLFLLSTGCKLRRELIFSLSQPGNHPRNWNFLIDGILKILNDYTQSMNSSIITILSVDQEKKTDQVQAPVTNQFVKNYNYCNMRNMTLQNLDVPVEFVTVCNERAADDKTQTVKFKIKNMLNSIISTVKKRTGINYLCEELPATNIQFLLSNGQTIIWIVQGLSSLAVASLKEDKFGVMQKDLPIILSTLAELRVSIEKLNRIPTLARKSQKFDDYTNKMRANINSAVKRSLYQICNKFGPYLKDLPLSNDVVQVLNHIYTQQ